VGVTPFEIGFQRLNELGERSCVVVALTGVDPVDLAQAFRNVGVWHIA